MSYSRKMEAPINVRRLADANGNVDGVLALLIMMIFIFCAAWAPTCIRRCYRRSDTNSRRRRSSGIDPRMQAEIDMFRRMMEEAALAITPQGGMTLDTRREYILNCLMTKHVISGDKANGETKIAATNEKDDVVLDLNKCHENGDEDDPATTCAICLSEYEDGDEISWSHNPNCSHFFHRKCIAEWLLSHEECPCCRCDFLSFDGDDERGDIESGFREFRFAPPVTDSGTVDANVDFARSMQLFFEMVATGRPNSATNAGRNENGLSGRATASLTTLETPVGNSVTSGNETDSQEQSVSTQIQGVTSQSSGA